MNKETYEALKEVVSALRYSNITNDFSNFILNPNNFRNWLAQLQSWIEEVAKEYEEEEEEEVKGWSECNHYVTDNKGLCTRCHYNTRHLTNKELRAIKD